jgi:tetratricopeptide (TPR) repeat protein
MANSPKERKKRLSGKATSGAVGGPSTGAGLNYQYNYAVLRLLELVVKYLTFPLRDAAVGIEPRFVTEERQVTRWDLAFELDGDLVEAKLNPTNADLADWIKRSVAQHKSGEARFVLVCGKTATRLLISFKQLIRIAKESGDNEAKFNNLVELEDIPEAARLLLELGDDARELLQRMKLREITESNLSDQIDFYCDRLAGSARSRDLRDFLFARVSEAAPSRETLRVADLVKAALARGFTLSPVPAVDFGALNKEAREALLLLNICPVPMHGYLLAAAIGTDAVKLKAAMESAGVFKNVVVVADDWKLVPSPVPLPKAGVELCERGLRTLLTFISKHKYEIVARTQVPNALALAQICSTVRPHAVARMFIALDKAVKGIGNKHLVLTAAELAIAAARRALPRGEDEAQGEAQAMVCGVSWALQRIGRLDEAMIAAKKSLKMGQDIQWDRNTSYCQKCIGRLYRIMAENATDQVERKKLFESSVAHLEMAIYLFSNSRDFGPTDPEVGDCHSLLARTYLSAGDRALATEHARKAAQLLTERESKDYLDLQLLQGELIEKIDRKSAESYYVEVVRHVPADNSEISEIVARAYFRLAINRATDGRKALARADFQKAKDMWLALEETENAAKAAWEILKLEERVPEAVRALLSQEPFSVRVATIENHERRTGAIVARGSAFRMAPAKEYWVQLIKEAQSKVSIESREW